ncbi:hypothetical protein CcrColossus_gp248 [Caulobacter phage CcrColossus]|uniref:Uncharacterized protein n=1 Tax=Caulobacter phage CcrColossus TaxID=1211640 RepID=K4JW53_9CAUD|nr:hypothetical protein CcrColossus_gp248 [Caulobacter phage CcrColossus]AFU88118.1 hypothetical protein CcrColossus_gp248 [Caulobacter phage CcrColossus]
MTKHADKRSVHTDALETLGTIIGPEEKRDAIHIAVENVVAAGILRPGEDVGFLPDGTVSSKAAKLVGIVDPFLKDYVEKGQRFWLLVYPRQIKSLRHVWTHPDFPDEPQAVAQPVRVSRARTVPAPPPPPPPEPEPNPEPVSGREWIEQFADRIGQTYDDLMEAADRWAKHGSYTYDNAEGYKSHWDEFQEFWTHWSLVTGREKPEDDSSFFTCSC